MVTVDASRDCACAGVDNRDDSLFEDLPTEMVPVARITLSQYHVSIERVIDADLLRPVYLVRHGRVLHLVNGHHRYTKARVLDRWGRVRAKILER